MPTDDAIVHLFHKCEEVLGHNAAVTLMELLRSNVAEVLDRRVPGWRVPIEEPSDAR